MDPWTRYSTAGSVGGKRPTDNVEFSPGQPDGFDRRLLGDVANHRILDLGTGAGRSAVALAKAGARVVAIDPDDKELGIARTAAEDDEVHVELHATGLADLAFLPADAFDAVISIYSLATISDIGRVFRQVHRLLKSDRPLVLSLPHPVSLMVDPDAPTTINSSYAETKPLGKGHDLTYRHTISEVFTQLSRANFRVDTLIEPDAPMTAKARKAKTPAVPASIVMRARKIGT